MKRCARPLPDLAAFLDASGGLRYRRPRMFRLSVRLLLLMLIVVLFPHRSPAPLVYRPGEGWTYESVGGTGSWRRERAKDQMEVAVEAFNAGKYSLSQKAAKRVVGVWPLSDYAPQALYLIGRAYEAQHWDEKAFATYSELLKRFPKAPNYDEVLERQLGIANRFFAGQWFRLWGVIPFFPSMEKTAQMYREIVLRGPYSPVAPVAQLSVGASYDKLDRPEMMPLAAQAYVATADKYYDRKGIAAEALYRAGQTYQKQAKKAEYDQSIASQAISTFTDFIGLYPGDVRVTEAQRTIADLKLEQARGALDIAKYYEKKRRRDGALVYYNEVIVKAPNSEFAEEARERIAALKASGNRGVPSSPGALPQKAPEEAKPVERLRPPAEPK